MRINSSSNHSKGVVSTSNTAEFLSNTQTQLEMQQEYVEHQDKYSKGNLKQAVDSVNEIFEINNKNLRFVYHEGLKEYYVELVNSDTEEVIKEIPSKKLLDAFYEMQKLVGLIVDEKI